MWYTANGTFYASNVKNRVTSGNFDDDGCDEIAAMYYYPDWSMKIFVFDPVQSGGVWSMSGSPWYSDGAGMFDANMVTGRFAAGDFDGDGRDEVAAMFKTSSASDTKLFVFDKGTSPSFSASVWYTPTNGDSFAAANAEGTFVTGNFVGDSRDDIAVIYKYPSTANVLVFEATDNHFAAGHTTVHRGQGNYTFEGMQYGVFGGKTDADGYEEIIAMYRQGTNAFSIFTFENTSSSQFAFDNGVWNSQAVAADDSIATTTRVATEKIGSDTYAYTYDVLGNITEIKKNGSEWRSYEYDALGELIRENNDSIYSTFIYTYDSGGNILTKTSYLYTTGEITDVPDYSISYSYNSGDWRDLLTAYGRKTITYDAIGNPTSYLGHTLTWTEGRSLSSIQGIASYTYDSSGIRTGKTVGGTTYKYYLDGSKIVCEERSDGIILHFFYDENGDLFAFDKGSDRYYYVRNILGEIIGIVDTSGSYVAKYTYDAWGDPIDITDGSGVNVYSNSSHIANINPFRYKGYYYDRESKLYYLQSRYYDPEVGRWINPEPNVYDGIFDDGAGLISHNTFAYCANNPIIYTDNTGEFIISAILIGATIGLVSGAVSSAVTQKITTGSIDWGKVAVSSLAGAVGGAIGGGVGGALYGIASSSSVSLAQAAVIGGTSSVAGGIGARSVYNAVYNSNTSLSNQMNYVFSPQAMATDYVFGGVAGGTFHLASNLSVNKIGLIDGVYKRSGDQLTGYPGVRYMWEGKTYSIELHPNHHNHGVHLQMNQWWYNYSKFPGQPVLGSTLWRYTIIK